MQTPSPLPDSTLLSTWHETYVSLRKIARGLLLGERPSHTLGSGDLVAIYVEKEMARTGEVPSNQSECAQLVRMGRIAMYRILVDYARKHKHRLAHTHCEIEAVDGAGKTLRIGDAVSMADYLAELALEKPRCAQVVDLRFYWGLTIPQVAEALDVSESTVEEDWREARAWLKDRAGRDAAAAKKTEEDLERERS